MAHVIKSVQVAMTVNTSLSLKVGHLYELLIPGCNKKSVGIYVDSWGTKRLVTLAIRRWRSPVTELRDTCT